MLPEILQRRVIILKHMTQSKTEILKYIEAFADRAHGDQVRKYTGERYIAHPIRVMNMVAEFNNDVSVLGAALLHDVLEDTPVTREQMERALSDVMEPALARAVVNLVVELTDIFIKAEYPALNRRARKEREARRLGAVSADAQTVKYADIIDNVTDIVRQDTHFARTFVREAKRILAAMDAGDPALRRRAMECIERSLSDLQQAELN
jgi:guanosine-3',5'-bis(diphosphate) 3'-pyrophosphohydrolase